MFINFLDFCEKNNLNAFDYVPFTVVVKMNGQSFRENMKKFEEIFVNIKEYITTNSLKPKRTSYYSDMFKCDINNLNYGNCKIMIPESHYLGDNLWLVKPTDLFGGKCIQISDSFQGIEKIVKKFYEGIEKNITEYSESDSSSGEEIKINNKYRASTVLVQKYIESPLLYYGRKFDIRMWALIDSDMNLYCFREGHLKTTSKEYSTKTTDKFVHITNYSMQKHTNNFEKFEIGNEVSFKDFQNCLNKTYNGIDFYSHFLPQMHEIMILTALSVKDKINKKERKFCYLILGYDFMIDTNFKVWLIEINKNPGLIESSPVLNSLLPRMLDDCFKLTIDKIFDSRLINDIKYPVENYEDGENMFQFLKCLKN
jgi:tubulin--tyrosine ligase